MDTIPDVFPETKLADADGQFPGSVAKFKEESLYNSH
jgi:hypothetical protein